MAKKKYYISHPKKERENYLLEASKFHEYIVREQLEEIANYLHSQININSLKIEGEEGNDFSSYNNIVLEEMNLNNDGKVELKGDKALEIKWSENDTREYEANQEEKEVDYLESENINGKNNFLWIEDFKDLVNKVQELKASNKRGEKESLGENFKQRRDFLYLGNR